MNSPRSGDAYPAGIGSNTACLVSNTRRAGLFRAGAGRRDSKGWGHVSAVRVPRCRGGRPRSAALRRRRLGEPERPGRGGRWPSVIAPTGSNASGISNSCARPRTLSGGMPKKQAPSPASTAVCRISSEAIAASMCQNGTGQRASSSVGPALVGLGVPAQVGGLARARHHDHGRAHHAGQPLVRVVDPVGGRGPVAAYVVGGVEDQEPPALAEAGARGAWSRCRGRARRSPGRPARRCSCGPSCGGVRRPGTPWSRA